MVSPFLSVSDEVYQAAQRITGYLAHRGFQLDAIHQYTSQIGVPNWWALRWKNHRTGEKKILPMRESESGFELKRADVEGSGLSLYRLHVLASYSADIVYLVEGESCVDLLEGLGLMATTWPNGAKSVGKADWSPLAGRRVLLWPDNDEPGAAAMATARLGLHKVQATVLALDVGSLELPPKGDSVDWLNAFLIRQRASSLHELRDGHSLALQALRQCPILENWEVA